MRVHNALLMLFTMGSAAAQTPSASPKLVLVELFTSEGCSSCPPADALLRSLDGKTTEPGRIVIGISEHVTYWNQLGWVDPFSDQTYTARQNAYGEHFGLDSVYTPQIVVNGHRQVLGSDRVAVLKAVAAEPATTPATLHIESVGDAAGGKTMPVTFSVEGANPKSSLDVYAIVTDDSATSSVLRGENSGRTLQHVSVARSLTKVATLHEAKTLTVSISVPSTVKGQPETARHLVLFVQRAGSSEVLAVDRKAF